MSQMGAKKSRKGSPAKPDGAAATSHPAAWGPVPPTIIEYSDQKEPRNAYPERIVSPLRSGPCCFTDMEEIGQPIQEGRWLFRYRRCRKCGFAVRVILREIPDQALLAELRRILATSFVRNVPE